MRPRLSYPTGLGTKPNTTAFLFLSAVLYCSGSAADVANAIQSTDASAESIVVAFESCIESFSSSQDVAKKTLSKVEFGLLSVGYCSCMSDALRTFPLAAALDKKVFCLDSAKSKASKVVKYGRDVPMTNLFRPKELTTLQIYKFYLKCVDSSLAQQSKTDNGVWCSCQADYFIKNEHRDKFTLVQSLENNRTSCNRQFDASSKNPKEVKGFQGANLVEKRGK